MAGQGYKLFVNGNTLSASDLNTYVQQQTVMVFATTTARTTALSGVLAEGMVSYVTGTGLQYYTGSAWVNFDHTFSGSSSGTTLLQASATASGTLTLPAATDTLVGKATTDTLTNKTLTSPVISTISNTGTLTLPTSTDTLVGRATTDTLTNKTLTDPVVTESVNAQTGTTYTPVLGDAKQMVTLSNASAITVTIPPNSSVAYAVGSKIDFIQKGAGQVSFAQGSGVTIRSTGATATAPKLRIQYSACTAWYEGSDVWYIVGDLA